MLLRVLLLCIVFPVAAGAQTLDKIRKSGTITLGYIDGAAPFSYADGNGEAQGYSVELCRAVAAGIAAQLKRANLKTRWVKLTIQNRIDAVRQKKVDLECSTTTWTLSRQQLVDFSLVTFVDGGSLLVRADSDAGRINDFNGKRIAAITGTTTDKALRAALARLVVKAEVVPIKTRDEGLGLLSQGKVDALASDRTSLIGLVVMSGGKSGTFKLSDQDFSIEQY
ncbi:MAG TPA: amino acid ABC transporter substrate-binding protein, partial [Burkholderiales bacterium]|nr:amino acid ABC transporter substrate-binding protein [Burkholderiales bacterium]